MPGAPASSTSLWSTAGAADALRHRAALVRGRRDVQREPAGARGVPERGRARVRVALPLRVVQRARSASTQSYSAPADWGTNLATWTAGGTARSNGADRRRSSTRRSTGRRSRSPRASRSSSGSTGRRRARPGRRARRRAVDLPAALQRGRRRRRTSRRSRGSRRTARACRADDVLLVRHAGERADRRPTAARRTTAVAPSSAICTSPATRRRTTRSPPPGGCAERRSLAAGEGARVHALRPLVVRHPRHRRAAGRGHSRAVDRLAITSRMRAPSAQPGVVHLVSAVITAALATPGARSRPTSRPATSSPPRAPLPPGPTQLEHDDVVGNGARPRPAIPCTCITRAR